VDITSADLNDYIRQVTGWEATAKDFRTWAATVRAFVHLASCEPAPSTAGRTRQVAAAMRAVADHLGNTAAVARASYVDPRLADRHLAGALVRPWAEDGDDVAAWERALLAVLG
jgi:DNA topoisomerase IB